MYEKIVDKLVRENYSILGVLRGWVIYIDIIN